MEQFDAYQAELRAEGFLRTETAPQDAPYEAADLVRNFERIALHHEVELTQTGSEDNWSRNPLERWVGPLNYALFGAAVTPQDRLDTAQLMERVAGLTGLEIAENEDDFNFLIMITTPEERNAVSAEFADGNPEVSEQFDLWRRTSDVVCYANYGYAGEDDSSIDAGLVVIGMETRGLLRKSCLHEEIVQTLGLPNDHPEVRPSIFNDDEEFALLTRHDEDLLRILYDPRLSPGMTAGEAMPIVRRIVAGMALGGPAAGGGADGVAKQAVDAGT